MTICCVGNCKYKKGFSYQTLNGEKVSTHKVRPEWFAIIRQFGGNNASWKPVKTSRICSIHFEPDSFDSEKKSPKKDAMPTLFGDKTKLIVPCETKEKEKVPVQKTAKNIVLRPSPAVFSPLNQPVFSIIQCPNCPNQMNFPPDIEGSIKCNKCKHPIVITLRQEVKSALDQPLFVLPGYIPIQITSNVAIQGVPMLNTMTTNKNNKTIILMPDQNKACINQPSTAQSGNWISSENSVAQYQGEINPSTQSKRNVAETQNIQDKSKSATTTATANSLQNDMSTDIEKQHTDRIIVSETLNPDDTHIINDQNVAPQVYENIETSINDLDTNMECGPSETNQNFSGTNTSQTDELALLCKELNIVVPNDDCTLHQNTNITHSNQIVMDPPINPSTQMDETTHFQVSPVLDLNSSTKSNEKSNAYVSNLVSQRSRYNNLGTNMECGPSETNQNFSGTNTSQTDELALLCKELNIVVPNDDCTLHQNITHSNQIVMNPPINPSTQIDETTHFQVSPVLDLNSSTKSNEKLNAYVSNLVSQRSRYNNLDTNMECGPSETNQNFSGTNTSQTDELALLCKELNIVVPNDDCTLHQNITHSNQIVMNPPINPSTQMDETTHFQVSPVLDLNSSTKSNEKSNAYVSNLVSQNQDGIEYNPNSQITSKIAPQLCEKSVEISDEVMECGQSESISHGQNLHVEDNLGTDTSQTNKLGPLVDELGLNSPSGSVGQYQVGSQISNTDIASQNQDEIEMIYENNSQSIPKLVEISIPDPENIQVVSVQELPSSYMLTNVEIDSSRACEDSVIENHNENEMAIENSPVVEISIPDPENIQVVSVQKLSSSFMSTNVEIDGSKACEDSDIENHNENEMAIENSPVVEISIPDLIGDITQNIQDPVVLIDVSTDDVDMQDSLNQNIDGLAVHEKTSMIVSSMASETCDSSNQDENEIILEKNSHSVPNVAETSIPAELSGDIIQNIQVSSVHEENINATKTMESDNSNKIFQDILKNPVFQQALDHNISNQNKNEMMLMKNRPISQINSNPQVCEKSVEIPGEAMECSQSESISPQGQNVPLENIIVTKNSRRLHEWTMQDASNDSMMNQDDTLQSGPSNIVEEDYGSSSQDGMSSEMDFLETQQINVDVRKRKAEELFLGLTSKLMRSNFPTTENFSQFVLSRSSSPDGMPLSPSVSMCSLDDMPFFENDPDLCSYSSDVDRRAYPQVNGEKLLNCIFVLDHKTPIPESLLQQVFFGDVNEALEEIPLVIAYKIRKNLPLCSCQDDTNHSCEINQLMKCSRNVVDELKYVLLVILNLFDNPDEEVSKEVVIQAKAAWNHVIQFGHNNLVQWYSNVLLYILSSIHLPTNDIIKFFEPQCDFLERNLINNDEAFININIQYALDLLVCCKYVNLLKWCDSMLSKRSLDFYLSHFILYCCFNFNFSNKMIFKHQLIINRAKQLIFTAVRPKKCSINRLDVAHYYIKQGFYKIKQKPSENVESSVEIIEKNSIGANSSVDIALTTQKLFLTNNSALCDELENNLFTLLSDRQTFSHGLEIIKTGLGSNEHVHSWVAFCLRALQKYRDCDLYVLNAIFHSSVNELSQRFNYIACRYIVQVINVLKERKDLTQILTPLDASLNNLFIREKYIKLICNAFICLDDNSNSQLVDVIASLVLENDYPIFEDDYSNLLYQIFITYFQRGNILTSEMQAAMLLIECSRRQFLKNIKLFSEQLQGRDDVCKILNILKTKIHCKSFFLRICFCMYPRASLCSYFVSESDYLIEWANRIHDEHCKNLLKSVIRVLQKETHLSDVYAALGYCLPAFAVGPPSMSNISLEPCQDKTTFLNQLECAYSEKFFFYFLKTLYFISSDPFPMEYMPKFASLLLSTDFDYDFENFSMLANYIQTCKSKDLEHNVVSAVAKVLLSVDKNEHEASLICKLLHGRDNVMQIILESPFMNSTLYQEYLIDLFVSSYSNLTQNEKNVGTLKLLQLVGNVKASNKSLKNEFGFWQIVIDNFQESDDFLTAFAKFCLHSLTPRTWTLLSKFLVEQTKEVVEKYFSKLYEFLSFNNCHTTAHTLFGFACLFNKLCDISEVNLILHVEKVSTLILCQATDEYFDQTEFNFELMCFTVFKMLHKIWSCESHPTVSKSELFSAINAASQLFVYIKEDSREHVLKLLVEMLNNEDDMNTMLKICNKKFLQYFSELYLKLDEPMKSSFITAWTNIVDFSILENISKGTINTIKCYCREKQYQVNDQILSLFLVVSIIDDSVKKVNNFGFFSKLLNDKKRARQIVQHVSKRLHTEHIYRFFKQLHSLYYEVSDIKAVLIGAFISRFFDYPVPDWVFDNEDIKHFCEMLSELDKYDDLDIYVPDKNKIETVLTEVSNQKKYFTKSWSEIFENLDKENILDGLIKLYGKCNNEFLIKFYANFSLLFDGVFNKIVAKRCVPLVLECVQILNEDVDKIHNLLSAYVESGEINVEIEKENAKKAFEKVAKLKSAIDEYTISN